MGGAHSRPASETELRAAFRDVDMHDTGFIEVDEITSSLQLLYKVHSSAMAVREIMAAADTNSDGSLSYREFKLMLYRSFHCILFCLSEDLRGTRCILSPVSQEHKDFLASEKELAEAVGGPS